MPPNTGRANGNLDDDDYVAQVLTNEARDSSLKYSALGMGAYMPKRPTGAAPKPNTRFLRHIIKETDNHNSALKRKEEREARERMRQLRNQPASSSNDSRKDSHSRQPRPDDRKSHRDRREDQIAPIDTGGGVIHTARMKIDTDLLEEVVGIGPIPGRAVDLRERIEKRNLAVAIIDKGGALGHLQGLVLDQLKSTVGADT
ncbi:hypothetical protein ANOM_010885 [Aspergillus nomiae NRRL 13137]|uniref:Uncharacterized protein n=1 Tax=Aspergillus nomiae NRRL (strain ATCC 15546 / NRRL 13137 / CBS 260.88 / M93) TaxID=1509407 RepID=A0A0L1IKH5_ASPN3|nr:uncharacterized protein ANOM_010885 [Aspergillus nomiae NRRL 13137]KNG80096.1 hypothetical protein ANOM_010885 [Aspergillus nomiae NRRL 13137]